MDSLTRRAWLARGAWLVGAVCSCSRAWADLAPRSTSSFTPALEPACFAVGPNEVVVDLQKTPLLDANGNAALLKDDSRGLNLIVVRLRKNEYRVLGAACTHAGRPLAYNRHRRIVQCVNFHHSAFDLQGGIVKGPAPKPIKSYPVRFNRGRLTVRL